MSDNVGADVRRAYDGPDIQHDQLIDEIVSRNREDRDRASSAGESRQKIGTFLEKTGMNSQAYSWMRTILKKLDKNDGQHKAMDVIASVKKALPIVEAHVTGQGTVEMPLPEPEPKADPVEFDQPDTSNDAYGRGQQAFANGDGLEDNPFDAESHAVKHGFWADGWHAAEEAASFDSDVDDNVVPMGAA